MKTDQSLTNILKPEIRLIELTEMLKNRGILAIRCSGKWGLNAILFTVPTGTTYRVTEGVLLIVERINEADEPVDANYVGLPTHVLRDLNIPY